MKSRFIIYALVLVLVILAVVFGRRPVKHPAIPEPISMAQPTNNVPATPRATANVARQRLSNSLSAAMSRVNPEPFATNNTKALNMHAQFVRERNVPIQFYGQFIDQDSNAISGVDIKVMIVHLTMPNPLVPVLGSKDIELERTSDANGRFEINGETGEGFDVTSVVRDGYDLEPGQRSYGPVSGTFDSPVIFKMWSTNIHEQLIGGNKSFHIVPDGRPYFINLTDDTINESGSGDLKIWIQYTNSVQDSRLYDWSAGIVVIGGGLLEEGLGTPMYEAPISGYVPEFHFEDQIKGYQRGGTGERQFYLILDNGKEYGQMTIGLYAPYNQIPGLIRLSYAINPSSSRILR